MKSRNKVGPSIEPLRDTCYHIGELGRVTSGLNHLFPAIQIRSEPGKCSHIEFVKGQFLQQNACDPRDRKLS